MKREVPMGSVADQKSAIEVRVPQQMSTNQPAMIVKPALSARPNLPTHTPLKKPGPSFTLADSAPRRVDGSPPTAVVIDDDRTIRTAVAAVLREAGYLVEEGENGAAALRLVQGVPDVMVLDMHLPDLSGLAICRVVRGAAKTASVPVVFLTASDDDAQITSGFIAGATDYIVKPFVPEVLAVRVNRVARTHLDEIERVRRAAELDAATVALQEARANMQGEHRLSGLGILVSGVATEMNSPLAAIHASLEAAMKTVGSERSMKAARDALASASALSELVRRLRGIAGTDDRARTDVELRARCALVARAFVTVPVVIVGESVTVPVVDAEIREALIAVIDNAVHAASKVDGPQVQISIKDEGAVAAVTVDDNGEGIADADVPWLSMPYSPTRGAGMGLSLVTAAAARHGGSVDITGHGPLGGARVVLRLPKIAVDVDVAPPPPIGL